MNGEEQVALCRRKKELTEPLGVCQHTPIYESRSISRESTRTF